MTAQSAARFDALLPLHEPKMRGLAKSLERPVLGMEFDDLMQEGRLSLAHVLETNPEDDSRTIMEKARVALRSRATSLFRKAGAGRRIPNASTVRLDHPRDGEDQLDTELARMGSPSYQTEIADLFARVEGTDREVLRFLTEAGQPDTPPEMAQKLGLTPRAIFHSFRRIRRAIQA